MEHSINKMDSAEPPSYSSKTTPTKHLQQITNT